MSIKEAINKRPAVTSAIVLAVAAVAVGLNVWQHSSQREGGVVSNDFFSDDDGNTWFLDNRLKVTPFDHNGKQAYRAVLLRCKKEGKPFVAYLQKWSDSQLAAVKGLPAMEHVDATHPALLPMPEEPLDVKKPGVAKWVSSVLKDGTSNPGYAAVVKPVCPDGSTVATRVTPFDPDVR